MDQQKSFLERFWWVGLITVLIFVGIFYISIFNKKNNSQKEKNYIVEQSEKKVDEIKKGDLLKVSFPACPQDLSGVLTYPIVDLKYIRAIRPNGDVGPPGHTSPVDHATFMTDFTGKILIYAPADGWITRVEESSRLIGDVYKPADIRVYQTICDGLEISAAGYNEITFQSDLKDKGECREGIEKPGHNTETSCDHRLVKIVKAGDLLGYTSLNEIGVIPFEWWAYNQNQVPRTDVNWDYYKTDDSKHAMCLFDLYGGQLKADYYKLFGRFDIKPEPKFIPRTIPPLCGEVNQDKIGTIQGMWFGGPPDSNSEFQGKGIAFIHNAFNPAKVLLSIGGNITGGKPAVIDFIPKFIGIIDRDPGDIRSDGKIYCYDLKNATNIIEVKGKILVQLVDNNHLKAENQPGSCTAVENFKTPFFFER